MKYKEIINDNCLEGTYNMLLKAWSEPHRYYHNTEHLEKLLDEVEFLEEKHKIPFVLASYFHDVVYDPISDINEDMSIHVFNQYFIGDETIGNKVRDLITITKQRYGNITYNSQLEELFHLADNKVLLGKLPDLIKYEDKIFKEFQFCDYSIYQKERIKFLESCDSELNPDLDKLIDYVKAREVKNT